MAKRSSNIDPRMDAILRVRVKKVREQLGLSQPEFGQLVGHDRNTICRIERGLTKRIANPVMFDLALDGLIARMEKKRA